jgi:acetyltransferase-like isoleucine patch superfamily enzyme
MWTPTERRLPARLRLLRIRFYEAIAVPNRHITIGRYSYFNGVPKVHSYPGAPGECVRIGSFCSIANDVEFVLSGNHDRRRVTTSPVRKLMGIEDYDTSGEISGRGDIVIGNDVWIGRGAMILSGAVIGDGALVGARAVVSGTIEPYAIAVGNPCREVGRRFDEETVARLLASEWWQLPDSVLRPNIDRLSTRDVAGFLEWVESLPRQR